MDNFICAVYARVSTDKQGDSLENQIEYAKEYIRRLGDNYFLNDAFVYQDFDQSGYYTRFVDREAIQRALNDAAEKKFQVIVFKEISRISRDQAEHIELVTRFTQNGVRVIAINDNVDSARSETLDLLGIHSVMAEMESKRISSRVSAGNKSMARRGLWVGEPPIGYKVSENRALIIDEEYAEIPKLIFALYVNAGYGTFKIAEHLNQNHLMTKNGNLWSRTTVNRVLNNRAYIGDLVYGKTRNTLKRVYDDGGYRKMQGRSKIPEAEWVVLHNTHPALISNELFEQAQTMIRARSKQNPRRTRHPLTGILKCGRCGSGMVCQKRKFTNRSRVVVEYRYYSCSNAFKYGRSICDQQNMNATSIEKVVKDLLLDKLSALNNKNVDVSIKKTEQNHVEKELRKLKKELERTRVALDRLLKDTDIPHDTYELLKMEYVQSLRALEVRINNLSANAMEEAMKQDFQIRVANYFDQLSKLDLKDVEKIRRLFHELISEVVVDGTSIKEIKLKYFV